MEPNTPNNPAVNTPPVNPQPVSQTPPPSPAPEPVMTQEVNPPSGGGRSKKMMIVVLLVVVIVLVLVAVVFGSGMMNRNSAPVVTPTPVEEAIEEELIEEEEVGTNSALLESTPYADAVAGFSISAPSGWKVQKNPQQGVLVIFSNPNEPGNTINIVSESTQGMDLQEYVDVNKEQIQSLLANYTLVDDEEVDLNGQAGYIIGGTFGQEGSMVKNKQLIVVKNNKAYVVTATSAEDMWPESEEVMDASLMTFKAN